MGEGQKDRSAAYLTPVPANAVVYGSGESALILTKVCLYERGTIVSSLEGTNPSSKRKAKA
jgi:hypothetical protein